jgi:hypothetical protein
LLRPWLADLPLNTFPLLQAHDAGTVYLAQSDPLAEVALRFARTQSGGSVTALLDCGARAFDWRPALNASGFLGFGHGPVFVGHAMVDAAREVAAWASAHAAEAEDALVLILAADCDGACKAAAAAGFAAAGIPVLGGSAGCALASDLTVASAMAASQLAGGGHGTGRNESFAFGQLLAYNANVTAAPLPSGPGERGLLSSIMGCWAQNTQSTILSFLHDSSLLLDDTRSQFNSVALLDWVRSGNATHPRLLEHLSLVGSNNVCDGGGAIWEELKKRLPAAPEVMGRGWRA